MPRLSATVALFGEGGAARGLARHRPGRASQPDTANMEDASSLETSSANVSRVIYPEEEQQAKEAETGEEEPAPIPRVLKKVATSEFLWSGGVLEDVCEDAPVQLLRFKADPGLSWRLEMCWYIDGDDESQVKLMLCNVRAENMAHLRVKTKLSVWTQRIQEKPSVELNVFTEDGTVGMLDPSRTIRFTVKLTTYYKVDMCNVCADWKRLRESLELADLTLRVDGQDLRVHRQVLCARSAVMRRMLLSDFAESRATEIEIQGIPPAAFSKVLEFLYTGQVEDFEGYEMDVLVAADRYAILDLKDLCQKELVLQLNSDNVLQALVLADNLGAKKLKEGSLNVAVAKIEEIMKKVEWIEFRKNHDNLVDDILIATRQKCSK